MERHDVPPVPVNTAQWPEPRALLRNYHQAPEYQARLAMALLGLKALFELEQNPAAAAVTTTLRAFHERFPEFTLDEYRQESDLGGAVYRADPRLQSFMAELLSGEHETTLAPGGEATHTLPDPPRTVRPE